MAKAKLGDTVKVHYSGKLNDGTQFDSSAGRDPLEFVLGNKQVIAGFEKAVLEMAIGDKKTVRIKHEDAYGPHRYELVQQVHKDQIPADMNLKIGDMLRLKTKDGHEIRARVSQVNDDHVTLDANHALAGKDLTFSIELIAIV
jgi:peptidylprolyl isomerase